MFSPCASIFWGAFSFLISFHSIFPFLAYHFLPLKISFTHIPAQHPVTPSPRSVRKNRGNQLFKEGRIDEAMEKYQAAFSLVQFVKDSEACADLKFALHLNKAAVLQKIAASKEGDRALDDWRSVVSEATNALEMKAHSAKALFRRGVAYMNLDELELARSDLAR